MAEPTNLEPLNAAAAAISEELFKFGFGLADDYGERFAVPESDRPLMLANAYYRVAVESNAILFRLDGEELGRRMMQVIKDVAREAIQRDVEAN